MLRANYEIISGQLNDLMRLVSTLRSALAEADEFGQHNRGAMDGGVKSSLESTLIRVCNRIDSLMADSPQWKLDADAHALNLRLLEGQLTHVSLRNQILMGNLQFVSPDDPPPQTKPRKKRKNG